MISIFARPSYVGNRFPRHTKNSTLLRVSSRIRGEEIAEFLGCQLNVKGEGVNVHVKPAGLSRVQDGDWVDFLDGEFLIEMLKKRPRVKVIAASKCSYDVLRQELKNEMVLIPQQHINWNREKRVGDGIVAAGYIGSPSPYAFKHYEEIGKEINKLGLEFKACFDFKTKQDSINFYKSIDIMVIGAWDLGDPSPHKIPTKIINAASFGIPTVAFPLNAYQEIEGNYLKANNMQELIAGVKTLMDEGFYHEFSERIRKFSEAYHISKIAKMYQELK
jgi:hypothetical protein